MNKSTLPTGLKTLKGWYDKGSLRFDLPIQRNAGMWNHLQKSMLDFSILNEYPVPPIYLIKYKNGSETTYQAEDGKQRCTSLFEYIDGGFALHTKVPPVEVDGTTYDIAGLTFEELSAECKDALLGFRFTIYCLEDATDEQIEEIFELINNSTPLSTIQKSKAKIGTELSKFLNGVLKLSFWQDSINLTVAQMRREDNLLLLLQSALLLNMKIEDYSFKSISAAECLKFCEHLRDSISDELKDQLENITIYLSDAYDGKGTIKYLRKNNAPIIFTVAKLAMDSGVDAQSFMSFVDDFFVSDNKAYKEFSGSGNVKKVNVLGRLAEMTKAFAGKFDVLSESQGVLPEQIINSDPETDNEDDTENSEDNADEPISEDANEDASENTESDDDKHYVLFKLSTNNVGQENEEVYEVDSVEEDYLNEIGHDFAQDNADSFGVVKDDTFEDEPFSYSWEILTDLSREEIIEMYGAIQSV